MTNLDEAYRQYTEGLISVLEFITLVIRENEERALRADQEQRGF